MPEFLTRDQLSALKSHSYRTEGRSILDEHVLRHFWNFAIRYIPTNWAPNLITLIGIIFVVLPFIAFMIANPDAKRDDVPAWIFYAMAFGIFMFQTLDNLDGHQARRTGTSSPLGEFFDHGCDSISDACMTLSVVMALKIGANPNLFFVMGLIVVQDYCFFWRAHWTRKYVFGDIDVSEIQWLIITILAISGFTDTLWSATIFNLVKMRNFLIFFYFAFNAYYIGDIWVDAVKIALFKLGNYDEATRQNVLAPMNCLVLNMALAAGARFFSGGIYEHYPVAFIVVYALIVAKLSCRLIIANMTKTRMVSVDSCMLTYGFMLLSNKAMVPGAIYLSPSSALFIAGVFACLDLMKYGIAVCSQLADFLDVNCLTITKNGKTTPPKPIDH